ncbi:uncharacterized protein LOC117648123 [Thrips palmi]|uniref:Uncharacterized protein LOC117648123 n=1 Tax=Thrips palmi TaxID=161013 RepID=A0A6P8Z7X6_THRPL|nr:uncharacterized protein LOC117648123 [Thrips palmi]
MAHNVAREPGTRPNSFFYHIENGFYFHESDRREGTIYYKCVRAARGCYGRASYDPMTGFVLTGIHNHEADPHYADEMALRRNILQRCENLDYVPFTRIILEESRGFHPEVAARVTYARMRTPMRQARMRRYPHHPNNLRELTALLQDNQHRVLTLSHDGNDNIYGGSVDDADGEHHILFVSNRMLQQLKTFHVLHADGTFDSVPVNRNFAAQVWCILGVWDNTIIPLAWALMSRKTENAYIAVLHLLLNLMDQEFDLQRVITDFEDAEQNAWHIVFGVHTQGCHWHLGRDHMQQLAELDMLRYVRDIGEVRQIVRECICLALLPRRRIVPGYLILLRRARQEGPYIFRIVRPYLVYVWNSWIRREVRRNRMCVFGSEQRTNNAAESGNKSLNDEVGNHAMVFNFLEGLVRLEQRSNNNILGLDRGLRVNRGRKLSSIFQDQRIARLGNQLLRPHGNINAAIARFLREASHLVDNIIEDFLQRHPRRQQ